MKMNGRLSVDSYGVLVNRGGIVGARYRVRMGTCDKFSLLSIISRSMYLHAISNAVNYLWLNEWITSVPKLTLRRVETALPYMYSTSGNSP